MKFGRKITFVVSGIVMVVVILLKGKSLLMMDIFSGILFAAPTSSLIAGMYCKRTSPKIAVFSIVCGLASGLIAFFVMPQRGYQLVCGEPAGAAGSGCHCNCGVPVQQI